MHTLIPKAQVRCNHQINNAHDYVLGVIEQVGFENKIAVELLEHRRQAEGGHNDKEERNDADINRGNDQ